MNALTIPQASIKYYVTDSSGRHIMTAPLSTLARVFSFTKQASEKVEKETVQLNSEVKLHLNFSHYEFRAEWSPITVRRLPIEIPRQAG